METRRPAKKHSYASNDKEALGDMFPLFRRRWLPREDAICIIGSCYHMSYFLHAVRIEEGDPTDEEIAVIKKDPIQGANAKNVRLTTTQALARAHPELLIEYWEKNIQFVEQDKPKEELTTDAARARLVHMFTEQDMTEVEGGPIHRDMLRDLPDLLTEAGSRSGGGVASTDDQEPSTSSAAADRDQGPSTSSAAAAADQGPSTSLAAAAAGKKKEVIPNAKLIHADLKKELMESFNDNDKLLEPPERTPKGEIKRKGKNGEDLDEFGLPDFYGETDWEDWASSSSHTSSDEDEEEELFVPVRPRPKKKRKTE